MIKTQKHRLLKLTAFRKVAWSKALNFRVSLEPLYRIEGQVLCCWYFYQSIYVGKQQLCRPDNQRNETYFIQRSPEEENYMEPSRYVKSKRFLDQKIKVLQFDRRTIKHLLVHPQVTMIGPSLALTWYQILTGWYGTSISVCLPIQISSWKLYCNKKATYLYLNGLKGLAMFSYSVLRRNPTPNQ